MIGIRRAAQFVLVMMVSVWLGDGPSPLPAHSAELRSAPAVKIGKIVAAGFGFQTDDSSTITVKTYDADSGEVLSNEVYELAIKEDGSAAAGRPRARVVAGGAASENDAISEFTVRVYDAADGRFLWEGRLNLAVNHIDGAVVRVVAQVEPRTPVRRAAGLEGRTGQPYFLLRAMNAETGSLMWSDQFPVASSGAVRAERIGWSQPGMTGMTAQEFEFRIRMFDEVGRLLLWEDQVTAAEEDTFLDDGEAVTEFLPRSM